MAPITHLRSDGSTPVQDIQFLDQLMKNQQMQDQVANHFKVAVYMTVIFGLMSLPFVTDMIKHQFPSCKSDLMATLAKMFVFFILAYIVSKLK